MRRIALGIFVCAIAFGSTACVEPEEPTEARPESTPESSSITSQREISETDQAMLNELLALGYLEGSNEAPAGTNVIIHDREAAYPGLNLMVSGHGPEAILFDMDGKVLHRWRYAYKQAWPDSTRKTWFRSDRYWRRAHLFENGDLLAIFDGLGLLKVDKDSNLLWTFDGHAHHDLFVTRKGLIYTFAHVAKVLPEVHPTNLVLEDFIVILSPDGKELSRISLFESLRSSEYAHWLEFSREKGDIFHTNTIEVLDGRLAPVSEHFEAGNVLVSIHGLDAIAVVDLRKQKIVWGMRGPFKLQHQPTALDNGNILIFDNLGGPPNRSRVIEIEPMTGEIVWSYQAEEENEFYTFCCGSSERLPNGNTLITDTAGGTVFEVSPDKEIVWQYRSPYRTGDDEELVASLFEVVRLPADFPIDWANGGKIGDGIAPTANGVDQQEPIQP